MKRAGQRAVGLAAAQGFALRGFGGSVAARRGTNIVVATAHGAAGILAHGRTWPPAVYTRVRGIFTTTKPVTAASGVGSGSGAGAGAGGAAPAVPAPAVTVNVWAKLAGGPRFVMARSTATHVDGLIKDVAAALGITAHVSTLMLRVVQVDEVGTITSESKTTLPSMKALAGAELDGAFLILEVAAVAAAEPVVEPLVFKREELGGELVDGVTRGAVPMMVASVPREDGIMVPIFLTEDEHDAMVRFIKRAPNNDLPDMLMPVGTIKSGKTTLVTRVIERLVVGLRHEDARAGGANISRRPPPAFFKFAFDDRCKAEDAARVLAHELQEFARLRGVAVAPKSEAPATKAAAEASAQSAAPTTTDAKMATALDVLPGVAGRVAEAFSKAGRELWLLIDEVQGPVVGSNHEVSDVFAQKLKQVVQRCSPFGRIAMTGSGMAALLDAIRRLQPNGFTLWDACDRVPIGREPPPAVALAMARRLVAAYSVNWPAAVARFVTAERLVEKLTARGPDSLFSARPALMAYVLGLTGANGGTPERRLAKALRDASVKLVEESARDIARLLLTMTDDERVRLRRLADGELLAGAEPSRALSHARDAPEQIASGATVIDAADALPNPVDGMTEHLEACFPDRANVGALLASLCEAAWSPRLLPPYGMLLRSWIEPDGAIAFVVEGDTLVLPRTAQENLTFISDYSSTKTLSAKRIPKSAETAASVAVLDALLRNGVGVRTASALRVPRTAAELSSIPAVAAVITALNDAEKGKSGSTSEHVRYLQKTDASQLGWWLLKALRHMGAHVPFTTPHVLRNGLTAVTAVTAVRAAATAIAANSGGMFVVAANGKLGFATGSSASA